MSSEDDLSLAGEFYRLFYSGNDSVPSKHFENELDLDRRSLDGRIDVDRQPWNSPGDDGDSSDEREGCAYFDERIAEFLKSL